MPIIVRVLLSILIAMLVPIGFWIGGWEFDRGQTAGLCYLLTVTIFALTVTCPWWRDLEND